MKRRELARDWLADALRKLSKIEEFSAEDCEVFLDELMREYQKGDIPEDIYQAIDEAVEKRYATLKGIPTLVS